MKLFEDLPSQNTPINAENLNQIQDNLVVVSPTEPTGDNREKVWMQKGKNLFNKNGTVIVDEYMDGGTGEIKTYTNGTKMFILEVQPSTSYTISKTQGGHFRVGTTPNYPSVGAIVDGLINNSSATSITITTNSTAKYLCCSYWQTGVDTITEESMRESIQVEQGSTATKYEEYIEPKIYVKNDNDIYEEFISKEDTLETYSTSEQRIGTWINGKPLYRKVITGAVPIANNDETYTTAQYDVAENIDPYGMFIEYAWIADTSEGAPNLFPLPYVLHTKESNVDVKHLTINGKYTIMNSLNFFNNMPFVSIIKYTKTTD